MKYFRFLIYFLCENCKHYSLSVTLIKIILFVASIYHLYKSHQQIVQWLNWNIWCSLLVMNILTQSQVESMATAFIKKKKRADVDGWCPLIGDWRRDTSVQNLQYKVVTVGWTHVPTMKTFPSQHQFQQAWGDC